MSLLLAMCEYLVAEGLCIGDGEDCFRDFTPESPDSVVVLHEYAGDPISPYAVHVHRSVQVRVRDRDAEAARRKAAAICDSLRSTSDDCRIDFNESLWAQVYIRQAPFKLAQDESNRVVYCFNLGITTNILE